MNRPIILRLFAAISLWGAALQAATAQVVLPVTLNTIRAHDNWQTTNGVPLSDTRNVPPGSDGRAQGPNPGPLGTPNQFQGLQLSSGVFGSITNRMNGSNGGRLTVVGKRTRAGAPYVSSPYSYLFGQIIPPPETDEYGVSLALPNAARGRPATTAESYWLAQPYTTNNHAGYYWSPHAETVYASQPGVITVTWQKAAPS